MKTSVCSASPRRCPEGVAVTILADRGFGDVKLFAFLDELGFDYVIRFRGACRPSLGEQALRKAAPIRPTERARAAQ